MYKELEKSPTPPEVLLDPLKVLGRLFTPRRSLLSLRLLGRVLIKLSGKLINVEERYLSAQRLPSSQRPLRTL